MRSETHKENISKSLMENQNAVKAKTEEEMVDLLHKYCQHLAKGFSKDSFWHCDYRTIEKYVKDYPTVLQSELLEIAFRKNKFFWESMGIAGTMGKKEFESPDTGEMIELKSFNALSWAFNMKNRLGWTDRNDITSKGDKVETPTARVFFINPNKKISSDTTGEEGK